MKIIEHDKLGQREYLKEKIFPIEIVSTIASITSSKEVLLRF